MICRCAVLAKAKLARKAREPAAAGGRASRSLPPDDETNALAKLDAWVSGAESDQAVLAMHTKVGLFLHSRMRRAGSVVLDPMIVPYG